MITLSKSGNAVKFTFDENDHYLQNGTIEVPVNSLALIIDDSDMATFRKSASNDIFISANYSEFGMSKAELEAWYKTYMVGSSGGGGGTGGTTPEEVQQMIDVSLIPYSTTDEVDSMIDESVSGKADSSAVDALNNTVTAHTADTTIHVTANEKAAWNNKSDFSGDYNDLTNKPSIPTVPTSNTAFTNDAGYITSSALNGYATEDYVIASTSTKLDVSTFETYSGNVETELDGKQPIGDYVTNSQMSAFTYDKQTIDEKISEGGIFDPTQYYTTAQTYSKTETNSLLDEKLDVSAFTAYSGAVDTTINSKASQASVDALNGVVTAHTANTEIHVSSAEKSVWNAKSDFSGSYNDLTDKPTIPTVPTSNTAFTNDAGYITSGEAQTQIVNSISGKADADDVYKKTETSSKTEIDDALLLNTYEDYNTKNTYTNAFPSLTGTADWNSAIQGGIYAMHSDFWADDSYEMSFKLQVIDENGNTFSAATSNITERNFTVDNVNPLSDYIDVVRPTYEESPYYGRVLASWIFKPKDGYKISYAEINSYWEDEFRRHNSITEIEWNNAFPSGYTKDIIENYIEPKLANAQEKLSFDDNVRLRTSEGKLVPYVPTDYSISDWYSGSTNPVQTQAVYKYTYSKAETDSLLNAKVNVVDNEVPDYNVTNEITYQGGYPSQTETASSWDDASMFTLRCDYFKISDTNYTTTAAVIDPSGNITTGSVTTDEYRIGNPLTDYIDMIREGDDFSGKYYFTAKEGYRIAHLDIYSSRFGSYGTIVEERTETVFEGGQSADVIKDVIEPTLINKQDKLVAGENITISGNVISSIGGGSSYTAGTGIDITNDVISVTGKVSTSDFNTYTAATNTALASKQTTLTAGTGISIVDNVISAEGGGGMTEDDELLLSTALTDLNDRKIDASEVKSNYQKKGDYVTTSTLNARLAEYETALDEQNVEEVTAYALNELNERLIALETAVQALQALHNNE